MKIKLQKGDCFPLISLVGYNLLTAGFVAIVAIDPKHRFDVGERVIAIGGAMSFDAIAIVMSLMALSFTEHLFGPKKDEPGNKT